MLSVLTPIVKTGKLIPTNIYSQSSQFIYFIHLHFFRAFFAYDYPTRTQVNCSGSGSGDINEFFNHVKGQNGGYGFCRIETGDEESRRAKFFLLAWVPESGPNKLPIMVKGNMSVHKASFKEIFRDFNSEFTFSQEEDLNAEAVTSAIIKAGGANYMGQAS